MEYISENELKISHDDILLIKRVALSGNPRKIILDLELPATHFTVTSNKRKIAAKRINHDQIEVTLPNSDKKIKSFVFKGIVELEIQQFGGLQVLEWPSIDLYRVSTTRRPYQILGFKYVKKIVNEDYWIGEKNVTTGIRSHVARKRVARIELIDTGLPVYRFNNKLTVDCTSGGRIHELYLNIPQHNNRQKVSISSGLNFELKVDENNNQRICIVNPGSPGKLEQYTIEFTVEMIEKDFYQDEFGYPDRVIYKNLPHSQSDILDPGEFWMYNDEMRQVVNATDDMKTIWQIHRFLFEFANRRINYEINEFRGTAISAFNSKKGDCSEYADLLIAFHRLAGIPSRLKEGVIALGENGKLRSEGHAWVEFLTIGGWVSCDPTWGIPIGVTSQHIDFQTHVKGSPPSAFEYLSSGPNPAISWDYDLIDVL